PVLLVPAEDLIVGNIAPHKVASDTVPCWTLRPECPAIEAQNGSIANFCLEATVQCNHIRFRISRSLRVRMIPVHDLSEGFRRSARSKRCNADLADEIPASSQLVTLVALGILRSLREINEPM